MTTNLKNICKLAGIKQISLAKEVGVAQGVISDWQNGKYYPAAENVIKLSKILNVSAGCILGLEPIPDDYPFTDSKPVIYNEETEKIREINEPSRFEDALPNNNLLSVPEENEEMKKTRKGRTAEDFAKQLHDPEVLATLATALEPYIRERIMQAIQEDTSLSRNTEAK